MQRFIAWSLVAVTLAALATPSAYADVNISLNIVFNDFLDPSQGGNWSLVAKTDTPDSDGIVALVSRFGLGTIPATGTVNPNIGHDILGGNLGIFTSFDPNDPFVEFLYGQDPGPSGPIPGLVLGVGLPGGPSDVGPDFLGDPTWDNASEIAFGTTADLTIIPDFLFAAANEVFETIGGGIVAADIGETVVRFVPESTTQILVDIKPGSFPNSVNLKSKGVLPVAILGTEEFDVSDVDIDSLLFGDPLLINSGGTAVSPLRSALEDVSGDGLLDLTLKFSMRELVGYDALGPDTLEGLLTGELLDGTPFEGMDSIRIVPPNKSNGNSLRISAVPEPTTSTLALAALCLAMCRRRSF